MRILKKASLTAGLVLLASLVFVVPASYAEVANQATEMTFNQPVQIPGQVLPAGTYWFTVANDGYGQSNVVQIYNPDGANLIAQVQARQTDKTGGFGQEIRANGVNWPTGKLVMVFAESQNQPPSLLAWYYPGTTTGNAFIYSSRDQKALDEETHDTVAVNPGDSITVGRSLAAFE